MFDTMKSKKRKNCRLYIYFCAAQTVPSFSNQTSLACKIVDIFPRFFTLPDNVERHK